MPGEADLLKRFQQSELAAADPDSALVLGCEERRQAEKLIFIPSESLAPHAIREVLGSVFTNLYAEGYPSGRTQCESEEELADCAWQAALHRRYADRRFYRGTEFANSVEALARKRVAELFATDGSQGVAVPAGAIHANVQALSGAAANNAVYEACLRPGDTIMGMNLTHGGHLTHGSPYNRSGKYYNVVSYGVSASTGRLDYDEVERLAHEHQPRLLVAGASAYPWDIDWRRLRTICDSLPERALLLADIAHPAGLVVAGLFPNPVGYADVVTFTTHKTMIGPRGAVILTTDEALARDVDRAVFPGEQGGPHVNNIAAMAVAFKMAQSEAFRALQRDIVANAQSLAARLQERGLRLAYGGTNTHLLLVDLNAVQTPTGLPLKGDVAARLLDLADIVCNKNTIPGDLNAAHSSAIRLGTVWATQRGLTAEHMRQVADVIADLLGDVRTFAYVGVGGEIWRGKVELPVLRRARRQVRAVIDQAAMPPSRGAPIFAQELAGTAESTRWLLVRGPRAGLFLQEACTGDVLALRPGGRLGTFVLDADGEVLAETLVVRPAGEHAADHYLLALPAADGDRLREWLEALSDGYTIFDRDDLYAKVDGPVVVQYLGGLVAARAADGADLADAVIEGVPTLRPASVLPPGADLVRQDGNPFLMVKPYFVGQDRLPKPAGEAKPRFQFTPYSGEPRCSALYEENLKLTAARNMVPFAGWSMPVWYTGIAEEHRAVRETAGLFDVSHMGVLEVRGEQAARFLDLVTSNCVPSLRPGQAQYSYVLDPEGNAVDDVLVYCLAGDRYMLVVNAANAEKVKAWFEAVNSRAVAIDYEDPAKEVDVSAIVRDLKDPAAGPERRVDLSLQGPAARDILLKVLPDEESRARLWRLRRSEFMHTTIGGVDIILSRTGYTGEEFGYEFYLHPDRAPRVWRLLLAEGAEFGLKPAGLGARDSTRTEAGFPLYGHELAGPHGVSPAEAGYGAFVKLHKPFFVGRKAFIEREQRRQMEVVRFQMTARGVRMAKTGDPVVTRRGEMIGYVTSAVAVDGQQVGLAQVDRRFAHEGTPIGIFPLPRDRGRGNEPAKSELKPGERVQVPEDATIVARFPHKMG